LRRPAGTRDAGIVGQQPPDARLFCTRHIADNAQHSSITSTAAGGRDDRNIFFVDLGNVDTNVIGKVLTNGDLTRLEVLLLALGEFIVVPHRCVPFDLGIKLRILHVFIDLAVKLCHILDDFQVYLDVLGGVLKVFEGILGVFDHIVNNMPNAFLDGVQET